MFEMFLNFKILIGKKFQRQLREIHVLFTQFPPVITPFVTKVQYQNQDPDIGTLCVYAPCHFIVCVESGNPRHNQGAEHFAHPQISLVLSLRSYL